MKLYLIRHAHAVSAEEDHRRPLSARGRNEVARLVEFFRADGKLRPTEFWHSPLVRSQETATLLANGLGLEVPFLEMPGLEPEDDPRALVSILAKTKRDVAVVGHEPHLGALASLLIHGADAPVVYGFQKGAVLALQEEDGGWRTLWSVSPANLTPGNAATKLLRGNGIPS